jgi:hypothetical protein
MADPKQVLFEGARHYTTVIASEAIRNMMVAGRFIWDGKWIASPAARNDGAESRH